MPAQVLEDKMRRMTDTIVVPHHFIRLPGTGKPIMAIELMLCQPRTKGVSSHDQAHHHYHPNTDRHQPLPPSWWPFAVNNKPPISLLDNFLPVFGGITPCTSANLSRTIIALVLLNTRDLGWIGCA